jgi:DNA invertase Pin-like site-specific DNA recombinase
MNAILLARVSTRKQANKGHSLADQEKVLTEYAEKLNARIIDIVKVQVSGSKMVVHQSILLRVLNMAKEQNACVITTALDRLSRDASTLFTIRKHAQETGVKVFIAGLNKCISEMTTMEFGVLSSYAEYERQLVSKRTSASTRKRAKGFAFGQANASECGLMSSEKRRQIASEWREQIGLLDEVKSAITLLKKPTLQRIAMVLNGRGLLTIRGKKWSHPVLIDQLRAMGFNKWQDVEVSA